MAAAGVLAGLVLLYAGLFLGRAYIDGAFGMYLALEAPSPRELGVLAAVVVAGAAVSLAPALRAYRMSLAEGMAIKT